MTGTETRATVWPIKAAMPIMSKNRDWLIESKLRFWLIDNRILFKPETQHKVNKWRIKKGIFQTRTKDTFCRWSFFFVCFFLYVHDKISCPVLSFFLAHSQNTFFSSIIIMPAPWLVGIKSNVPTPPPVRDDTVIGFFSAPPLMGKKSICWVNCQFWTSRDSPTIWI